MTLSAIAGLGIAGHFTVAITAGSTDLSHIVRQGRA
jgi:hypothetical protein